MPRFYFDFDGRLDEDGLEFTDVKDAQDELAGVLYEVARDAFSLSTTGSGHWVCILRDEGGCHIRRADFQMKIEDCEERTATAR